MLTINFSIPANESNIAVGLSGGGDSMALAHMLCIWAAENDMYVHILTVDHNLRHESANEAAQVAEWVRGFPASEHHILTWGHDAKPETAIMEKARMARYDLMKSYCKGHNIQTLAIAHHADDQLETFLFRLCKGSGLDGLTGMEERSESDNVTIYRPLLHLTHDDLIGYCRDKGLQWIEDPSNHDEDYARPRLRKALAQEGLNTRRFSQTLKRLKRGRQALDTVTESFMSDQNYSKDKMMIDWKRARSLPLDIQIRIVQKALLSVGGEEKHHPPKLERVEEIIESIQPGKSATLYGCVLTLGKDGNRLEITISKA